MGVVAHFSKGVITNFLYEHNNSLFNMDIIAHFYTDMIADFSGT